MRPSKIVAGAVLTAALALVALPGLAGSATPSPAVTPAGEAFQGIRLDATLAGSSVSTIGPLDDALRSAGWLDATATFSDPGKVGHVRRLGRATAVQPASSSASEWKPARYSLTGTATFYDNGTTAMRLPRGTIIRVCGAGGCLQRTVTDYGPVSTGRVIDLYRPDFFAICGCASWSGTTRVTVYVY
jgi:hypothetical protein